MSKQLLYAVYEFDFMTYIVYNVQTEKEVCVCTGYSTEEAIPEKRANKIAKILNDSGVVL